MTNRGLGGAVLAVLLCGFPACCVRAQLTAEAVAGGTIRGRVVDRQTGEPIAKAAVSIDESATGVTTDRDGHFTLGGVPAGSVELRIFTVGYGLQKMRLEVKAGGTVEAEIRLGQAAVRDEITVVAGPFDPVVTDAVTQYSLDPSELKDLTTIVASDPFRAVPSMPGVTANQDFYASFATRGAGPDHIGVYLDGVLVDHPTYSLEDSGGLGALSAVDGNVVRSVTLLSGGFPASYGDRTGAILSMTTRDGARDRIATRIFADFLGATGSSEGPIGRAKKASWLVAGRQSYIGYLLSRLGVSTSLSLNYSDASGKLSYDLNAHHKFSAYSSVGGTSISRTADNTAGESLSFFTNGAAQHDMSAVHWDWILSPGTLLQSQGFWVRDHEHDTNPNGGIDLDTTTDVYGFRSDLTHQSRRWNKLQVGVESRSPHQQRNSSTQWNYATDVFLNSLIPLDNYARVVPEPGAYLEDTVSVLKNRLSIGGGVRWAYSAPTSQSMWMAHGSGVARATKTTSVSVAFGQYAQMPSLQQLYGAFGNPVLQAERSMHETFAIDQFFTEKVRLHVELYNRSEQKDIYSPLAEFRLLATGKVGFPVLGPVLGNTLDAYGRGFEITVERRSANRLSGSISYARNYSKYWQPGTSFSFPGDYDQRDTFSAYAAYRITKTIGVSANTRYGSGFPLAGFLASPTFAGAGTSEYFQLTTLRNQLPQGDYQRSDVRVNKVFMKKYFNLTVHGELENLTAHTNYAYYDFRYPSNISTAHQVDARRESTFPFLPAAGLTLEF